MPKYVCTISLLYRLWPNAKRSSPVSVVSPLPLFHRNVVVCKRWYSMYCQPLLAVNIKAVLISLNLICVAVSVVSCLCIYLQICEKLGWEGKGGRFDVLPLVLQAHGGDPEFFEIPPEIVLEVEIKHPK